MCYKAKENIADLNLPIYVLHHDDSDGFASALAAYVAFGDKAKYIAVQYGQAFPDIELTSDAQIFILDFSYKREILEDVKSKVKTLIVLDHHLTSKADLEGLDYAIFDLNKSGATLAWYYFIESKGVPYLIELVEDRDLWKFNLSDSKAFEAGIKSTGNSRNINFWYQLLINAEMFDDVLIKGTILYKNEQKYIESLVKRNKFKIINYKGLKASLMNTVHLISDTAEALYSAKELDLDFALSYFISEEGDVVFSFRSSKDKQVNVGELAKELGGGGHFNAAGVKMNLQTGLEFLEGLYSS